MSNENRFYVSAFPSMKPGDQQRIVEGGHVFVVTACEDDGFHTGRGRYRVTCESCPWPPLPEDIHEGTTGPVNFMLAHVRLRGARVTFADHITKRAIGLQQEIAKLFAVFDSMRSVTNEPVAAMVQQWLWSAHREMTELLVLIINGRIMARFRETPLGVAPVEVPVRNGAV
jgi:hypothetical protein